MKIVDQDKFEEFIAQYPVFEYRLIDPKPLRTARRVRIICEKECQRYHSSWACPPAVGTLEECEAKVHSYDQAVIFSSVAEVRDILDFEAVLATRREHEKLTDSVAGFFAGEGFETFTLSTESCDICPRCSWLDGEPCRFPQRMHPCIESYGLVVSEIVESEKMEYDLGGNSILWFSLILLR
ncbi:MAG: DUF2284 domain-containing protein [Blautia sp.]|nr:DUF2284 domain-containing protein [Blautia sp.]